ncbi:MAG TPA: winged helix-turn-helix domain-containing protein, partial [Candidatus Elarobacter sp.]
VKLRDKEFELIALLASSRGGVSRERIGEALWEHLDSGEWSNNLKVTLHRVRKTLGSYDVVLNEEARYRLAPRIDVDVARAERLVRERGDGTLDERSREELTRIAGSVHDGVLERYERFGWSHGLVGRLNDLIGKCGLVLAHDALAAGDYEGAARHAGRVRELDALNEEAAEVLVRALWLAGARDRARREFQRYAEALQRELATAPSRGLAEVIRVPSATR